MRKFARTLFIIGILAEQSLISLNASATCIDSLSSRFSQIEFQWQINSDGYHQLFGRSDSGEFLWRVIFDASVQPLVPTSEDTFNVEVRVAISTRKSGSTQWSPFAWNNQPATKIPYFLADCFPMVINSSVPYTV